MAVYPDGYMCSRLPIIVILGATGSGKSKLGIQLAKRFNGEIISADSMQVYKGLDIVNNKVTNEERAEAPHHMIDLIDPLRRFTVVDFRNLALSEMRRIHERGNLPIIVGGTTYYIESLLWHVLVETQSDSAPDTSLDSLTLMWERDPQKRPAPSLTEMVKKRRLSASCESSEDIRESRRTTEDDAIRISSPSNNESTTGAQKCDLEHNTNITNESTHKGTSNCTVAVDDNVAKVPDIISNSTTTKIEAPDQFISSENVNAETIQDSSTTFDVEDTQVLDSSQSVSSDKTANSNEDWDSMSNEELHAKLMSLDPDSASILHPNNRRKIIRSLQVWHTEGRSLSSLLQDQRSKEGGSSLGGPLRFQRSVILWLQCDQDTLDKRLDERVDAMMDQGLIQELLDFHAQYNTERLAENRDADYTAGIFQSIGLKEFHSYLVLPEEERNSVTGQRLMLIGVEMLKLATRRYARRQVRWIKNRFLRRPDRQVPPVYGLDTASTDKWDEIVLEPATKIVESLIAERPVENIPQALPLQEAIETEACHNRCEICDRVFVDLAQWKVHLASKKHKKQLARRDREKPISMATTCV